MPEPILVNLDGYLEWLKKYLKEVRTHASDFIYVELHLESIKSVKKGTVEIFYVDTIVSPCSEEWMLGETPFSIKDGEVFSFNGLECQCVFVNSPLNFTLAFVAQPNSRSGRLSRIAPTRNIEEQIRIMENIQNYGLLSDILLTDYKPKEIKTRITETKGYNPYQNEAIQKAISCKDFFLIHGPPGTGKTTVIAEIINHLVSRGESVLLTAWMNAAIDNALEKIVETKKITDDKIIRLGASELKLSNKIQHLKWDNKKEYPDVQVVGSTLALCHKAKNIIGKQFDYVIIDEAGAATLPETLLGMIQGEKFILVGDHYQLPPIISNYAPRTAKESLFEKMIRKWPSQSVMLKEQYRMNKEIADFLSSYIYRYEGGIETSACVNNRTSYLPSKVIISKEDKICSKEYPFLWVDCAGDIEWDKTWRTAWNKDEAAMTLYVYDLIKKYVPLEKIGVITTYQRQRALLRKALRSDILKGLDVSTIDSFQGREKDVILISFVHFKETRALSDKRKINVALSRAKDKIIIVADDRLTEEGIDIFESLWGYLDGLTNEKILRGITPPKEYVDKIEHSVGASAVNGNTSSPRGSNATNYGYTNEELKVLQKSRERKENF
ncbi:MAG: AAA domain-containing protein [Nanoarchaeota archaeon]